MAGEIAARLGQRLPINLRSQFQSAGAFSDDGMDHETWARHVIGIANMINWSEAVMTLLDAQQIRLL